MSKTDILGKIAFINHEKKYAMIDYEYNGRKKTIKGNLDEKIQNDLKEKQAFKKRHHYLMGDAVRFNLKVTEKGGRMIAANINFLYNNTLDVLINQARINNKFTGYLKAADNKYFVKEISSYLFFPIHFSPWQIIPDEDELNEPVTFSLDNLEKKEKISASLLNNEYIPEFHTAVKFFKSKTAFEATVTHLTTHGIYLTLIADKINAKIPIDKNGALATFAGCLKKGNKILVRITHIGKNRIVVEKVIE